MVIEGPQKGLRLKAWGPFSLRELLRVCQISLLSLSLQGNGPAQNQDVPKGDTRICQKATDHSSVEFYIKIAFLLEPPRAPETSGLWLQRSRGLSPNWWSCSLYLA